MKYENRTEDRNTEINRFYSYLIHSNPIRDNSGGIFPVEKSRIGKEWGKEHLTFVPLTKDNRLCAKEIIGNRANLTKWQDDFHAYMVEKYPDLERGESASKTGRKHIPTRLFKQEVHLSK